jgi:putative peptidoglycan lipid II flippase
VPATTILALVAFGPALGVYALAAGVVGGFAVQVACLGFTVRRVGYSLKPAWDTRSSEVRTIISQYVPMVAGAALMSGTALVDQSMAAMLPSGSVATLGYAFKVPAAVLTMVTAAVGTVVLPHFSGMVATRDWKGMAAHVRRYAQIATLWTTLATVALIAASHPTIRLLFQRGAFTVADTMRVANAQSILLAQLPFYVVGILFVRVTSALKRNDVLWWGAVISFPLNVGGNLVLMRYLGVNGIALSTVIVYVVSSVYLGWSLRRILRALIVQGTQKNAN